MRLSRPVPASRVYYDDATVWEADGYPGPVLHGYRDVLYHERYRIDHGLGPGLYRAHLPDDAGPCQLAVCDRSGRIHHCGD